MSVYDPPGPPPLEDLKAIIRWVVRWAFYKPPGEAVSGEFELKDFEQPKEDE